MTWRWRAYSSTLGAWWAGLAALAAAVASLLSGAVVSSVLPVVVGAAISRTGMDVAGVGCVGLALLAVLLPGPAKIPSYAVRHLDQTRVTLDRALVVLAGGWLVFSVLHLTFRAADAFGRPITGLSATDVGSYVSELAGGRGLVFALFGPLAVLVCGILRMRDRALVQVRLPLAAALIGLVIPGATGHAGATADHQVAVMLTALHIVTAALWVGGLAAILALVARHRPLLEPTLPRFSRVATWCLALVTVTGLANAALLLTGWQYLLTTDYGRIVIAKTLCLLALACLGGLTRRRMLNNDLPVLRWAGIEVGVMAATLGLAATLAQSA